jgi:predicted O-methyltransferase YrrM
MNEAQISFQKINEARRELLSLIKEHEKKHGKFLIAAPKLSQNHVKNCRLTESRFHTVEFMPKNGVVLEVGTQHGIFAKHILECNQPQELHLCDISFDSLQREYFQTYIDRGVVQLHEARSHEVLQKFPNDYFDWIYIDGGHNYETVKGDILYAKTKIKPQGYLAFNDYTNWSVIEMCRYGVMQAINEFCLAEDWEICYLALQGMGYHDVALRKIN